MPLIWYYSNNIVKKDFQKYFELIACLLAPKQHNALLMKNHEAHPTWAAPLLKVNMVEARDQFEVKRDDHWGYNNVWDVENTRDNTTIVKVVIIIKGRTTWVLKITPQKLIVIVMAWKTIGRANVGHLSILSDSTKFLKKRK